MKEEQLIPHFVADRPMSLRILTGLDLKSHPIKIGLMLQACSSKIYRKMISKFPCVDTNFCQLIHAECPYQGQLKKCIAGREFKKQIMTISDSGVFTKNGSTIGYRELFERYEDMKVQRGIILDVLKDPDATINSAKKAMDIYSSDGYTFQLVGVAQGKTPSEYNKCYEKLLKIGFEEIAIGGLLTKKERSARYASSNKEQIATIVKNIKEEWPNDRCFVLGVYNPKRHDFLESLGVHAADYKGWIFQYSRHYSDPYYHHIDRLIQTRYFIEKFILAKISNNPPKRKSIAELYNEIKPSLSLNGNRVYVKKREKSRST